MIRTALLVGASVIAAACVACTPKPPAPTPGPGPGQHRAELCNDEHSFIKSVHMLRPGYDPSDPGTRFADPPVTDEALPDVVRDDLRRAFSIAPESFQKEVCSLDGVFVNPTTCDNRDLNNLCFDSSWGFRSPYDPNRGKRYIAISLSNWTPGHSLRTAFFQHGPRRNDFRHAQKLTEYSTSQLNTLLRKLNNLTWKVAPKFDSKLGNGDLANTSAMTVLAVLAHEVGHIRWYDWVEPNPVPGVEHPKNYDPSLLMGCTPGGFFKDSWQPVSPSESVFVTPEWLEFGEKADENSVKHVINPRIADFVKPGESVPEGSPRQAERYQPRYGETSPVAALAQSLNELYNDAHPWASLLSSLTPTEDLVETYELSVLTGASPPLRSLRLNIRSPDGHVFQQDVVADLPNKPTLARKIACVSALSRDYR